MKVFETYIPKGTPMNSLSFASSDKDKNIASAYLQL